MCDWLLIRTSKLKVAETTLSLNQIELKWAQHNGFVKMTANWSFIDKLNISDFLNNHVMNKMEVYFHIFCAWIKHYICWEIGHTDVLAPQEIWYRKWDTKFFEQWEKPLKCNCNNGYNVVLCFHARSGHCYLLFITPRNKITPKEDTKKKKKTVERWLSLEPAQFVSKNAYKYVFNNFFNWSPK